MKQLPKNYLIIIIIISILLVSAFVLAAFYEPWGVMVNSNNSTDSSYALAAWWNPLSWNIWNNILNIFSKQQKPVTCTMEAKICPDGSSVGRTGVSCEFTACPDWKNYKNNEYGFTMVFPDSWKGYTIEKSTWQGWRNDGLGEIRNYSDIKLIFKNPQTTVKEQWQDIPIMVFTSDVWQLVSEGKISVSAAPIGPAKIGENSKYIFATPPRWYGFTDAIGFREAVDIVKTFKAF